MYNNKNKRCKYVRTSCMQVANTMFKRFFAIFVFPIVVMMFLIG